MIISGRTTLFPDDTETCDLQKTFFCVSTLNGKLFNRWEKQFIRLVLIDRAKNVI